MKRAVHDIAIVGVYTTQQALRIDREPLSLCLEAAQGAMRDAGIEKSQIDGICGRWMGPGGTALHPGSPDWSTLLGIPLTWIGDSYPSGVPALMDAAAAIGAGLCNTVLVVGGQSRTRTAGGPVVAYTRPDNEFTACYGSYTTAQFALVAQRYFHLFRPDPAKMAGVAASIRTMGGLRPGAALFGRGPFTAEDVMASPPVVEPFHLLELCLASEGAAAFIVTSIERARDCAKRPVRVLGGGMEWARQQYVDPPIYDEVGRIGVDAIRRATAMAGVSVNDLDVFQLYDANAFEIIRQLEVFGFCGEGEGFDFVAERGIGTASRNLPVNTDGGLMSFGHIGWSGPTLKVIEAVRQLRHEAPTSQVPDAELGIISGAGSGAQYFNLAILARG
ncbi:MAG: thiolase family protein [Alphaproteobacteria bacterium]